MSTVTTDLTQWICALKLEDVPAAVQSRTKALILDGLACGLVASHLSWSETGVHAMLEFEGAGPCTLWGWDKKVSPMAAALLNSSFVQGFEIDDFHKRAPCHGASLVLPALVAAVELEKSKGHVTSGKDFLVGAIVGLEVSPRVGLAIGGKQLLSRGIHSGTLMGHQGVAAAASKLLSLSESQTEDALGTASTQACGLMSAQAGSMVKRMQHGFAARNGLFAALMSRQGYTGIKQILDPGYGHFFNVWSGAVPANPSEVTDELGQRWEIENYVVKLHASMGGVHSPIECFAELQHKEPRVNKIEEVTDIHVEVSDACYHHGCFPLPAAPLAPTAAQMNVGYGIACQLVDGQVSVPQFAHDKIDRPQLREVVNKVTYFNQAEFDADPKKGFNCRITVTFVDGKKVTNKIVAARSIFPGLSDDDIIEKAQSMLALVVDEKRQKEIVALVLGIDSIEDVSTLCALLSGIVKSPV